MAEIYSIFASGLAGNASSGAVCKAGLTLPCNFPSRFFSSAPLTHSPTSRSEVSGYAAALAALAAPRFRSCKACVVRSIPDSMAASASASASASSEIVGGFISISSHGCRRSMAYVGRCLGTLCRHALTKECASEEKPSVGRLGGSPSTIACEAVNSCALSSERG